MEKMKIIRNELLTSFGTLKTLSELTMDDSETNVSIAKNIMFVKPIVDILEKEINDKIKELGETFEEDGQSVMRITDEDSKKKFMVWSQEFLSKEEEVSIEKIEASKLKGFITEKNSDDIITTRPIPISGSVLIALKPFLNL